MTTSVFITDPVPRAILGYLLAATVAFLAYKAHALTPSGAVATSIVGGTIVAAGGWWLGIVLIVYFASSSLLSSVSERRWGRPDQVRGKQRDAVQVAANGGIPVLLAVIGALVPSGTPWFIASLAAISGATADTWATEIGRWAAHPPRLITTGQQVPPGTSGGITLPGSLGSVAGALLIGVLAMVGSYPGIPVVETGRLVILIAVVAGGIAGSVADSLLGATVQEKRYCPACSKPTEQHTHRCGSSTIYVSGWRWLDNDWVNLLSIATAGLAGGLLWLVVTFG